MLGGCCHLFPTGGWCPGKGENNPGNELCWVLPRSEQPGWHQPSLLVGLELPGMNFVGPLAFTWKRNECAWNGRWLQGDKGQMPGEVSWCPLLILGPWCFQPFCWGKLWASLPPAWASRNLCPCWDRDHPLPILLQPVTLPSAPGTAAEHPGDEPALPLSLLPSFPGTSGGAPRALLGEPPGLAPHPSSFKAPCGRRKALPPNKFRFNLQVKKSVFFCS